MTAFVQAISRLTRTDVEIEPLKAVLIFSGIGLLLSLLAIQTYGLDLSAGFFLKAQPRGRDYWPCASRKDDSKPYSLPLPSVRDKLPTGLTVDRWDTE